MLVYLAILCLSSEILEKQFFGAKLIIQIELKIRQGDSDYTKKDLSEILKKNNLFEKIIRGHPSLIQKGSAILKVLFSEDRVSKD